MAPNPLIEEPIAEGDTLHYFMASLESLCPFIGASFYCGRPAKLPTIFPSRQAQSLVTVGPLWEECMQWAEAEGLEPDARSAKSIFRHGVQLGFRWTLSSVEWYHANHTDAMGWWTEADTNAALEQYGIPVEGRGYRILGKDEI